MSSNYLQIPGLLSGLNTADIIQKMMDVERLPLTRLQNKIDDEQKRQNALRDINTRLSSLLAKIQALNNRDTIDAMTVTTDTSPSSPALVTASANSDAAVGSFTVRVQALATSTTVTSAGTSASDLKSIGKAVVASQPLGSAAFSITPTTGTFTVNGVQITIDSSTVLSDGTDLTGANTIFAKIRDATASLSADKQVTVSWGLDANGRQNKLVLTASGAIQLGSGSDTSNFLTAAGLTGLPPATSMTSSRNLGGVKPTALLSASDANLDVALSSATGSFKINGVEITYDTSKDSLNDVISRINASAASVTATFDSTNDRLTITARNTGSTLIDLQDVTGNFLAAMKLSTSNESIGTNADYLLNGVHQYSASNTIANALPGVTINLKKVDPATDVTLTVGQDTSGAVAAVQDFVKQYNSAMSLIRDDIAYNANQKKGSILTGDVTVQGIENMLSVLVGGYGEGLSSSAVRSLSDIGITTGAVGSAVGSTTSLVLDTAKLTTALQSNPAAVADVFGALTAMTSLVAGGTGSIASISGNPSNHASGTYSIVSDGLGNLTVTFTPATGGSPTTRTGTITASGTNSTLIPGVTLTAKGTLVAGTDTITTTVNSKGVGIKLADYLNSLCGTNGTFDQLQQSSTSDIDEMNKSIATLQDRLDAKQQSLYARFSALEVALAQLQSQSTSLNAQLLGLSKS
ncbi:MAG: flagellar filament capping protein FliD [Bacteroidetes bacterium]|nr:flagellar filament capping protein FliD [Bacteroidota bacterium]MCL5025229.1 flagellar filament capping protein FliD [Chloroflexota bacterium]